MRRQALSALLLMLSAACARASAPPAVPAPSPAHSSASTASAAITVVVPDASAALQGHWQWTTQIAGESYAGTMDLTREGAGAWKARVVEQGVGDMPVSSVSVEGSKLKLSVEAQGTPALVAATLQADGTLAGTVAVSGGEGTFSAHKP